MHDVFIGLLLLLALMATWAAASYDAGSVIVSPQDPLVREPQRGV